MVFPMLLGLDPQIENECLDKKAGRRSFWEDAKNESTFRLVMHGTQIKQQLLIINAIKH